MAKKIYNTTTESFIAGLPSYSLTELKKEFPDGFTIRSDGILIINDDKNLDESQLKTKINKCKND